MASRIIGCGSYLPEKIITNQDLEKSLDTTDEWIKTRTGITKRHIAADEELTSDMALKAARNAIKDAAIAEADIDLIIVCTNTGEKAFPSVANKLQGALGIKRAPSFDLQAICSGFVYGMSVADNMLKSGKYRTVLLVGAEKMSKVVDWTDRKTCILFGDGAGAVILQQDDSNRGIIDSNIYSDGTLYDILYTESTVDDSGIQQSSIAMKGQELFKHAVQKMSESVKLILKDNDLTTSDIDYFIPHQANVRIINSVADKFDIDKSKVIITADKHANCSAASIPLALSDLKSKGNLKAGDIMVFTAFGAGLAWGALIIRW
ncbi:MAG: ketoacyl-ACP synthase III [Rickettsiaceae bacterium]|nr:ketoacyl-ACP synthase III [Rickettsiaceae bacterium]